MTAGTLTFASPSAARRRYRRRKISCTSCRTPVRRPRTPSADSSNTTSMNSGSTKRTTASHDRQGAPDCDDHQPHNRTQDQTPAASQAVGAVFLLIGILGFIPGITSNYGALGFAGHGSAALLLGIFQVSVLHDLVHLLFGAAGILMARGHGQARNFLLYGGIIYLVLWLYGLLVGHDTPANFVPVNSADNWLHLILGLGMITLAILLSRNTAPRR